MAEIGETDEKTGFLQVTQDLRIRKIPTNSRMLELNSAFTGKSITIFIYSELDTIIKALIDIQSGEVQLK